jgi:hypothetical protein
LIDEIVPRTLASTNSVPSHLRGIAVTRPASYENDYLRWLDAQAEHLRAGELDQLDREHLLEEIEAMGRSERRQVRNRLMFLIQSLLKMRHRPQHPSRTWDVSVMAQRVEIKLLMKESPSLRPPLAAALDEIYTQARREAAGATRLDVACFPEQCPFTLLEQVLDGEWWPGPVV